MSRGTPITPLGWYVEALLLASNPNLTQAQVRSDVIKSTERIPGKRNEVDAGAIDALAVVNSTRKYMRGKPSAGRVARINFVDRLP